MIKKETYADQIYEALKQDILSCRIGLGERLINRELQERYGVSSTPVRDAINRLYREGFLKEITRAGAQVIEFNPHYVADITEITAMLANNAIRLSAEKSSRKEMSRELAKILSLQRENQNNEDFFYYGSEFHLTFFRYSRNRHFCQLFQEYEVRQEVLVRYIYILDPQYKETSLQEHESIYQAYQGGDIQKAQRCSDRHFAQAGAVIQKAFPGKSSILL